MGNPVSAKSALDIARTALGEAMTQTPGTLATWDRGGGIHTNILINGVSWRWYAAGYVVPAGSTFVNVTATGGGVWVQGIGAVNGTNGTNGTSAPTFVTIAGSDFNLLVSGTTVLTAAPALATGAVITISGGDIYATITGTAPTSASPPYTDGTQIRIDPLIDAQAFRAIIKTGAPRLIGYWVKAGP